MCFGPCSSQTLPSRNHLCLGHLVTALHLLFTLSELSFTCFNHPSSWHFRVQLDVIRWHAVISKEPECHRQEHVSPDSQTAQLHLSVPCIPDRSSGREKTQMHLTCGRLQFWTINYLCGTWGPQGRSRWCPWKAGGVDEHPWGSGRKLPKLCTLDTHVHVRLTWLLPFMHLCPEPDSSWSVGQNNNSAAGDVRSNGIYRERSLAVQCARHLGVVV